ncbi:SAF domain-containing protein [Nostocoides sp. F2B08]|uniref:SAF domain-containing protein n=1 Tax=Nostocoides sp. F2B08 TaxID=2653936 RepID=UPI001D0390A5|nr:SAF domain-containing protein [Tetrasphaera sp. F2B08]
MLIAASVAAISLGALVSLWAYQSTSDTRSVLAVRQTIERGEVITADDLMTVNISVDPALRPLPADRAESVVGKYAALDMSAGGVVTQDQVTDQALPAAGSSVVGIALTAGMLPADQVRAGDKVRVVVTTGQQGEMPTGEPDSIEAVVVGVARDETTGNAIVNVQVPTDGGPLLAARAATGKVAIVLDSRE